MKKKIIGICLMMLVIIILLIPISVVAQFGCFKTGYNAGVSYNKSNIIDIKNTHFGYDDVLDQQQVDYTGFGWAVWGSNVALAQSFKPTLKPQTRVELLLWKVGAPTSLKVSIRSDLSGNDLTFVVISSTDISTTTSWKEFDFPDVNVNPGQTYYIVWEPLGTSNGNTFYWGFGINNPYTNGNSWVFIDSQWSLLEPQDWPGFDFCFKTYGLANQPPNTPTRPSGPTSGKTGTSYHYESYFNDPDGDSMEILFDWGDGTNTGWIGLVASGTTVGENHTYTSDGNYQIKTKARDIPNNEESEWSDLLPITMPYSYNKPLLPFLEFLFQRFPNVFPILRQLMGY